MSKVNVTIPFAVSTTVNTLLRKENTHREARKFVVQQIAAVQTEGDQIKQTPTLCDQKPVFDSRKNFCFTTTDVPGQKLRAHELPTIRKNGKKLLFCTFTRDVSRPIPFHGVCVESLVFGHVIGLEALVECGEVIVCKLFTFGD